MFGERVCGGLPFDDVQLFKNRYIRATFCRILCKLVHILIIFINIVQVEILTRFHQSRNTQQILALFLFVSFSFFCAYNTWIWFWYCKPALLNNDVSQSQLKQLNVKNVMLLELKKKIFFHFHYRQLTRGLPQLRSLHQKT